MAAGTSIPIILTHIGAPHSPMSTGTPNITLIRWAMATNEKRIIASLDPVFIMAYLALVLPKV
jgi:hypothetical protein